MRAGKIWGVTEQLLATPFLQLHRLRVIPNAWCSLHRHQARWNGFYVVSGTIKLEVRPRGYDLTDTTELGPGDVATVAPGLWHRFTTEDLEGAELLEFYYPDPLGHEDIERQGSGGKVVP